MRSSSHTSPYDATWSTHCRPEARAERVEGRELGGSRAAGQPQRRAVGEAVLADHVERLEVELALERAARLAEQVAHDGRQERRGRSGVPGEAVALDRGQRAAEVLGALEERDLVAELGQPGGGGHAAEATTDHHHTSHGGTLGVR